MIKVKNKFNIGDKVWVIQYDVYGKSTCIKNKILSIHVIIGENKQQHISYYGNKQLGNFKEERCFKTKREYKLFQKSLAKSYENLLRRYTRTPRKIQK